MSKTTMLFAVLALSSVAVAAAGDAPVATPPARQRVALESGITMSYVESGPADGPVLVLLHGLGDTSRSWAALAPALAQRHHVYALDLRGHGGTDAPACCYTLADLAYDVVSFMDARKVRRASVAGHSLGSFVAQHLAITYPARVDRLVLIGSADAPARSPIFEWLLEQARAFGDRVTPEFIDEWQSNPTPVAPEFLDRVKAETAAVPVHVWRGVARALASSDHSRFLGEIAAPTLVLWGEKDPAFPRVHQDGLVRAVPGARFKAYPHVGHNTHWEAPRQVAEDVAAFLGGPMEPGIASRERGGDGPGRGGAR